MIVDTASGVSSQSRETTIKAAAAGDTVAFASLYQEFAPKVYNLVLRSVRHAPAAEDVCQEVWVRAYQQLPKLREPAAFSTWLYRIASRACIDRARRPAVEEELPEQIAAPPYDDPEDATIRHERERLLWQALGALPARQHLALFLREVEGRSYQEIGTILDTTQPAVETLLFRARQAAAAAFERLEAAGERCGQAKKTMAVLLDGEATPVQRRAVEAHVDECRRCRSDLRRLRGASEAYGALPLLPVPAFLAERVLQSIGTATVGTGGGAIGKLLALFTTKAKLATSALVLTGGMAVATMAVPGDSPHLDAARASAQPGGSATGVSASGAGAAAEGTATPSGGLDVTVPALGLSSLPSLAAALETLQQLSQQMAAALPPLGQLSQTPAAALDQLAQLLTPPAVALATPPVALSTVESAISLPTATPPLPLPTLPLP